MIMSKETLIKSIREIPDFPIPGILFYDVTTLFKDPWCLQELSDVMYEMYKDKGITKVVGIESRGFIMGPILATRLNAGFIPIRKPGKLPAETIEESYDKEYGKDTVQIHKDALDENDVVLLHDDLLATSRNAARAKGNTFTAPAIFKENSTRQEPSPAESSSHFFSIRRSLAARSSSEVTGVPVITSVRFMDTSHVVKEVTVQ